MNKVNKPQRLAPNILNNANSIKINEQFILKLLKDEKNVSEEIKNSCKVIHFSSEWNFEEVLTTINELDPKEYLNLFIFVITTPNYSLIKNKIEELKTNVLKFGSARPLLVQLTFEDENFTIFYYKEESSNFMLASYPTFWTTTEEINNFPGFLNLFLNGFTDGSDKIILHALNKIENRSIILRFLKILILPTEFFGGLIINGVANGKSEDPVVKVKSALLTAVESGKQDVAEYLIIYRIHLVEEIPFDLQVRISTAAFETDQFDVLCLLLDIADFPFPENFKIDNIDHDRLNFLVEERKDLEAAIKSDNTDEILEIIEINYTLKVIYNTNNKSALKLAAESKSFKAYKFLKLRGFHSTNPNEELDEFDREAMKKNVSEGLLDDQTAVNLLCNRSIIHNKEITKEQEKEYRKKIRSWYEDISKIKNGQEFINVTALCPRLKIIFDFENETVSLVLNTI